MPSIKGKSDCYKRNSTGSRKNSPKLRKNLRGFKIQTEHEYVLLIDKILELFRRTNSHTFAFYINIANNVTVFEKLKMSWGKLVLEYFESFKTCALWLVKKARSHEIHFKKLGQNFNFLVVVAFFKELFVFLVDVRL